MVGTLSRAARSARAWAVGRAEREAQAPSRHGQPYNSYRMNAQPHIENVVTAARGRGATAPARPPPLVPWLLWSMPLCPWLLRLRSTPSCSWLLWRHRTRHGTIHRPWRGPRGRRLRPLPQNRSLVMGFFVITDGK